MNKSTWDYFKDYDTIPLGISVDALVIDKNDAEIEEHILTLHTIEGLDPVFGVGYYWKVVNFDPATQDEILQQPHYSVIAWRHRE